MKQIPVILLVLCAVVISTASASTAVNYQGMLKDSSGKPITTTGDIVFSLYDVATGGTPLDTDTHVIAVTDGLFTTALDFDPQYYDGRGLWLEISIRGEVLSPRQEFRPVPYALGLVPGAVIQGDATTNPSLKVTNTGSNVGNLIAGTTGENTPAVFAMALGPRSPAVSALSQNDIGVYSKGKEGGYFTTNQAGTSENRLAGVNVSTSHDYNPGVWIETTGTESEGIHSSTVGASSNSLYAATSGANSAGVFLTTTGANSQGINAMTQGSYSDGVFAYASGLNSRGVYGASLQSEGIVGYSFDHAGVKGESTNKAGVWGFSLNDVGVYGDAPTLAGVYGHSRDGVGVWGIGTNGGSFSTIRAGTYENKLAGVNVSTAYGNNPGVWIETTGYSSEGVNIETSGNYAPGVTIETTGWYSPGVRILRYGLSDYIPGWADYFVSFSGASVEARAYGTYTDGVYAYSEYKSGVLAKTNRSDHKYGVSTPDYMYAARYDTYAGDVAEYMPVIGSIEPGMVVVIGDNGRLQPSTSDYDTRVAGIVSTEPGMVLKTRADGNDGEALVALAGRVPCRVDASYGAIYPGDVLTTSPTAGHAMKAVPVDIGGVEIYRPSTVLGKALGTLEAGTGTIEVLVTLQ